MNSSLWPVFIFLLSFPATIATYPVTPLYFDVSLWETLCLPRGHCSLFPTCSSTSGGRVSWRELTGLYPRMTSLNFQNKLPFNGLVKKSANIDIVGQCLTSISNALVWSLIQKYLMLICLDFYPADICPFVSIKIVLSLSFSNNISSILWTCASINSFHRIVFGDNC